MRTCFLELFFGCTLNYLADHFFLNVNVYKSKFEGVISEILNIIPRMIDIMFYAYNL